MDKRVVVFIRLMSLFYLALISCDGLAGVNGNDDFQNATIITDFNQIIKTNNYGATKQAYEPSHADNKGGASVWWQFSVKEDGFVTIQTTGSSFDTLLAIYQGEHLNNLGIVTANDDESGLNTSFVNFRVYPGQKYYVAVDGYNGAEGEILLSLSIETTPSRYEVVDGGVVIDHDTGLMWSRCALGETWQEGLCTGYAKTFLYKEAVASVKDGQWADYSDWRLATAEEMASLLYCSSGNPGYYLDQVFSNIIWSRVSCSGSFRKPMFNLLVFNETYTSTDSGYWVKNDNSALDRVSALSFSGNHMAGIWLQHNNTEKAYVRLVRDIPNAEITLNIQVNNRQHAASGSVLVQSSMTCIEQCNYRFIKNDVVTLVASSNGVTEFLGWKGACSGTTPTCIVEISRMKQVVAEFSTPRFVDNQDGTITDTHNNLMWSKCNLGQKYTDGVCVGASSYLSWQEVKDAIPASYAGYEDWLLPSIMQLITTIRCKGGLPYFYADDVAEHYMCNEPFDNDAVGFDRLGTLWSSNVEGNSVSYLSDQYGKILSYDVRSFYPKANVRLVRVIEPLNFYIGTINEDEFLAASKRPQGVHFYSKPFMPKGFNHLVWVSIANGELSIGCSGIFSAGPVLLSPGTALCIRQAKNAKPGSEVTSKILIGDSNFSFSNILPKPQPRSKFWFYLLKDAN